MTAKHQPPTTPEPEEVLAASEATTEPTVQTPEQLAAQYLSGWQRALADYENLKRTSAQERVEFAKYATSALIEDLLPTIDYFDAAMRQSPALTECSDAVRKSLENWLVGIQHVQKLLMDRLAEQGLVAEEPQGLFNPNEHEAAEEQSSDAPDGTILQVLQRGFRLHGKLIRPARVIVSKQLIA